MIYERFTVEHEHVPKLVQEHAGSVIVLAAHRSFVLLVPEFRAQHDLMAFCVGDWRDFFAAKCHRSGFIAVNLVLERVARVAFLGD